MSGVEKAPLEAETKPTARQVEENQTPANPLGIDPEIERRVIRKMDLRVPTLLGALCEFARLVVYC